MINLKHLINFLPPYFRDTDTYKDKEGKGILERFLEISGEYLEEFITPEIDSLLDIIKIDQTETQYLNYLWEFLGEIPFAYGCQIDKEKWDLYHQNYDNPEELAKLAKQWEVEKTGPIVLSDEKVRDILKYSITLLKIRGTKRFFEFIFRLYGIGFQIIDPSDNKDANFWLKYNPRFDSGLKMDKPQTKMDMVYTCNPCTIVKINIGVEREIGGNAFRDKNSIVFRGIESIIFGGNLQNPEVAAEALENLTAEEKVIHFSANQQEYEKQNAVLIANGIIFPLYEDFKIFREMMDKFFYRFLPFNVIPHITFQGYEIDDHVEVASVDFIDPNRTSLVYLENHCVGMKVTITSNWAYTKKQYQVRYSADPATEIFSRPGHPHDDSEIFYAYKPGTYRFIAVDDQTKYKDVVINSQVDEKAYDIVLVKSIPSNLTITPDANVKVQLKATLTYKGKVTDCRIRLRGTDNINNSGYFWEMSIPGVYKFEIVEFPVKYYKLEILKVPIVYKVECNPKNVFLEEIEGVFKASTTLTVSDNYGTPGLTLTNVNTGEVYPNDTTINVYSSGIYTFRCTQDKSSHPVIATFIVNNPKELQYGIKVSPDISSIIKYGEIMEGRTYIKCSLVRGEPSGPDLNFQVRCLETGEVFLAGPSTGFHFRSSIPGTYTFQSVADPMVQAKWLLQPYQAPHENGLFVSPVEPEDPNWGTRWGTKNESRVAVYKLSGGICKFVLKLYIGGELIKDPSYKVTLDNGVTKVEYDLNTTIYLNEYQRVTAIINKGNYYTAEIILGTTFNNFKFTSSKGTHINASGPIVSTIITCTNEGGRDGTDFLAYEEGSMFKTRYTSPSTYFMGKTSRYWFIPADVSEEEQLDSRFSIDAIIIK